MNNLIPARFAIAMIVIAFSVGSGACGKEAGRSSKTESLKTATSKPTTEPASGAPSIDDALRALVAAWNRVEAVSAKVETWALRDIGDRAFSEGKGMYNYRVENGTTRLRYHVTNMINFWVGDTHYYTPEVVAFATDGKILEHLTLQHDIRQLVKTRYRPTNVLQIGGHIVIDALRADNKIESMKPARIDERDALVFECRANDGVGSSTYTFDVKSGIRVGWVERDGAGDRILSVTLSDLNLSPEFKDEDLTMVPVDRYTLIDETGPERREIPWEELSKSLPAKEPKTPEGHDSGTKDSAKAESEGDSD